LPHRMGPTTAYVCACLRVHQAFMYLLIYTSIQDKLQFCMLCLRQVSEMFVAAKRFQVSMQHSSARADQPKFHGSSFLVASSYRMLEDVTDMLQENSTFPRGCCEDVSDFQAISTCQDGLAGVSLTCLQRVVRVVLGEFGERNDKRTR